MRKTRRYASTRNLLCVLAFLREVVASMTLTGATRPEANLAKDVAPPRAAAPTQQTSELQHLRCLVQAQQELLQALNSQPAPSQS